MRFIDDSGAHLAPGHETLDIEGPMRRDGCARLEMMCRPRESRADGDGAHGRGELRGARDGTAAPSRWRRRFHSQNLPQLLVVGFGPIQRRRELLHATV